MNHTNRELKGDVMEEKLNQLKALLAEISDLNAASALMGWDQQVYMPKGGAEARGTQLATLQKLIHEKSTSPEIGQLLEDLSAEAAGLDPDSDDARLIKVAKRDYERAVKVPPEFTAEFAKVTSDASAPGWTPALKTISPNSSRTWRKSSRWSTNSWNFSPLTSTFTTRCWTCSSRG